MFEDVCFKLPFPYRIFLSKRHAQRATSATSATAATTATSATAATSAVQKIFVRLLSRTKKVGMKSTIRRWMKKIWFEIRIVQAVYLKCIWSTYQVNQVNQDLFFFVSMAMSIPGYTHALRAWVYSLPRAARSILRKVFRSNLRPLPSRFITIFFSAHHLQNFLDVNETMHATLTCWSFSAN